ncbi:hypothetical protein [Cellulosimicrobium sp. CUA-896]|uniref:hypothetical protein n=1 Tax=Cellulosimicrobium sp. CUA-896 TaxID=1517881 RepID=UPI0011150D63|nr:hypothetical protein [Cellulosimicrobium sp. CUA-896]
MTSDDVWVSIEPMIEDEAKVRVPNEHAEEMRQDLLDAGLDPTLGGEFSAVPEGVIWAVSISGPALTALVTALRAYWHRHDGKEVTLEPHTGKPVKLKGFPAEEVERLISGEVEANRELGRGAQRAFEESVARQERESPRAETG